MPSCLNQIKIAFYIVLDRADLFLFQSTIIDRGVVIIVSIDALNCGRTPVETVVPAVLEVELLYEVMEKVESRKFSFLSILSKADKQRICLKNMSEEGGGSQQQYQRSSHAASSSLCSVFIIFIFATFVVVFSVSVSFWLY